MTGITVRGADPDMPPRVAVIVAVPVPAAVTLPVASMVATEVGNELQVTDVVRSWVELFDNPPVAVNCCVDPTAILGVVGVTVMD